MNRGRNQALRLRITLILTLCIVAALGSFWLMQMMKRQAEGPTNGQQHNEPDYRVENFHFVRTSSTGQAAYLISGQSLTHHPKDNSADIVLPVAQSFQPNQAPLTMNAAQGRIFNDNQNIQLRGQVDISRPATAQAQALHLETESLLITTENDTMQTDDAVKMTLGNSILSGVGMLADRGNGNIRLLHQVRAIVPPNASRK